MDLLRKLRSIENGRLPKDDEISMGSSSTAMSLAFKSLHPGKTHGMKKSRREDGNSLSSGPSIASMASQREEESKDAASIVLDTESILSIVDEPYSNNDLHEHKQHALSSTMLRNLLQSFSPSENQESPTTNVNEGGSPTNESLLNEEMSQITFDTNPEIRDVGRPSGRGGDYMNSKGHSISLAEKFQEKESEDDEAQEVLFSIHDSHNTEENESVDTTTRINDEITSVTASMYSAWETEKQGLMLDVKHNIDTKITTAIDRSIEIIPVDLLIKYGKFELVQERALTNMWHLLLKMRLNLLRMATIHWKAWTQSTGNSIQKAAGALIVRICRGKLGRLRFKRIYKAHMEELKRQGRLAAVKTLGIVGRVIIIQSAIRRWVTHRRVKPLIKQNKAAKFIAITFRARLLVIAARRKIRQLKYRHTCALLIQKVMRGYLGKKKFAEVYKTYKHHCTQQNYATVEATFRYYFEQGGAASRIQHWFRNMPWYIKAKWQRKWGLYYTERKKQWVTNKSKKKKKKKRFLSGDDAHSKRHNLYAIKKMSLVEKQTLIADAVNHVVRGFLGRMRVYRIRTEIENREVHRENMAILIQKYGRRLIVNGRLPYIGVRFRSHKVKFRRWACRDDIDDNGNLKENQNIKNGKRYGKNGYLTTLGYDQYISVETHKADLIENARLEAELADMLAEKKKAESVGDYAAASRPGTAAKELQKVLSARALHSKESNFELKIRELQSLPSNPEEAMRVQLSKRRHAINLGNNSFTIQRAKDVKKMAHAGLVLTRSYRTYKNRCKFAGFMKNKQEMYATKLQKWAKQRCIRKRIWKLYRLLTESIVNIDGNAFSHTSFDKDDKSDDKQEEEEEGEEKENDDSAKKGDDVKEHIKEKKNVTIENAPIDGAITLWSRILLRRKSASIIQRKYRTHASMVWLRNFKAARKKGIRVIQNLYRTRIAVKSKRRLRLHQLRANRELRHAGKEQHDQTIIFTQIDMIWNLGSQTKSLNVYYDLQKFFSSSGSGSMLESTKFAKQMSLVSKETNLFKLDSPEIDASGIKVKVDNGKALHPKMIEDMFLKVKSINDKRISYDRWLDLLCNLGAIRFLGIAPEILPDGETLREMFNHLTYVEQSAGSDGIEGNKTASEIREGYKLLVEDEVLSQPQLDMLLAMRSFHFGKLHSRPALISKFVVRYVSKTKEYVNVFEKLKDKNSFQRATALITQSVHILQIWAKNRLAIKAIHRHWKGIRKKKLDALDYRSATKIQNMIRVFLGKILMIKLAQAVYSKYKDPESDMIYWFNPRTEKSFWSKPTLLGDRDCGNPISLPHDDEQHVILCKICDPLDAKNALVFCDECDDLFCNDCYEVSHRPLAKKDHLKIPLTLCVQCDFQAGARYCLQCQDTFCDSCYKTVHRKGRLKLHVFDVCTEPCGVCHDRSAQWTRSENDNTGIVTHYCIPCYKTAFSVGEHEKIAPYNEQGDLGVGYPIVQHYRFQGKSVLDFRGARDEAEKQAAIASSYEIRRLELLEIKTHKAATTIQKRIRGVLGRKQMTDFVAMRRDFFAKREKYMIYRQNPLYDFLCYWGIAPFLETDTVLEKVKKTYPTHMHNIIRVCLNQNWKLACELQREQDDHLAQAGNPSKLDIFMARMNSFRATSQFKMAELKLANLLASLEAKKIKYREAKGSTKMSREELKELAHSAEEVGKMAEEWTTIKQEREETMLEASQQVISYLGPRGLQKLVKDKRKNGILLPFRVHLHRGSRIAQVRYDEPPEPSDDGNEGDIENGENAVVESKQDRNAQDGQDSISSDGHSLYLDPRQDKKTAQMELVAALKAKAEILAAKEAKLKPLKDVYGQLILDEDGLAVDGYGNKLELDRKGNPILKELEDDGDDREHPSVANKDYGTWVKYVEEYEALLIEGVTFRVLPRDEFIKDMIDDTTVEDENDGNESDEDEEGGRNEDEDEDEEKSVLDETHIDYQDTRHKLIDLEIMRDKYSDDYICFDRPWMLDDCEYVPVFKIIPPSFYMQPIKKIQTVAITNAIPQKMIAISAITMDKISSLNKYIASYFDIESDMGLWFKRMSKKMANYRDSALKYSRSVVEMNYDFTLRRVIWKKSKKTIDLMKKLYRAAVNKALIMSGDTEAEFDLEKWEASENKVEIAVWLENDRAKDEKLGTISMDLTAPMFVMRLYLYRNEEIRAKLNALQGENFQFFVVKENEDYDEENPSNQDNVIDWYLDRDKEKMTYSSEFALFKMDNKTMEGGNRVSLVLDTNEGFTDRVYIPSHDKHGKPIEEVEPDPIKTKEENKSVGDSISVGDTATINTEST